MRFSGFLAFIVLATSPAFSQEVGERTENQQDRIAQGVKSGELTAGEATHLEGREASLNQEARGMRAANGGTLTAADKKVLNQQQNTLSKSIYQDKHNTQAQGTPKGEIGQRKENQQDRIAQGISSGRLSASEAARLESQQKSLNQEQRGMRAADGGKLTAGDKKVLNQQQNKLSRRIYRTKHDGAHK